MTAPAATGYRIIDEPTRIVALDADGVEICGAHRPVGHEYWSLYVTLLITRQTGLPLPQHAHFWGDTGRRCASLWVEMIASLYAEATS